MDKLFILIPNKAFLIELNCEREKGVRQREREREGAERDKRI